MFLLMRVRASDGDNFHGHACSVFSPALVGHIAPSYRDSVQSATVFNRFVPLFFISSGTLLEKTCAEIIC